MCSLFCLLDDNSCSKSTTLVMTTPPRHTSGFSWSWNWNWNRAEGFFDAGFTDSGDPPNFLWCCIMPCLFITVFLITIRIKGFIFVIRCLSYWTNVWLTMVVTTVALIFTFIVAIAAILSAFTIVFLVFALPLYLMTLPFRFFSALNLPIN